jgi:hypothetical protein
MEALGNGAQARSDEVGVDELGLKEGGDEVLIFLA